MDEVGGALIAIALVLCAVFIPSAFITGISGQFYRQFALTITGATVISLIVSLTLSPALCALLPAARRTCGSKRKALGSLYQSFFGYFNAGLTQRRAAITGCGAGRRYAVIMLFVYAGIIVRPQ
jgi:multidrug efflux pump subunit AcrB